LQITPAAIRMCPNSMLTALTRDSTGSPQYAASEIADDEITAKNWPPMQRADILNRRIAFRRHQFTPMRK